MRRVVGIQPRRRRPILAGAIGIGWMLGGTAAWGIDSNWTLNGSGDWSNPANWSAGVPNASGDGAHFLGAITAPATITQDVDGLTLGSIEFDNANAYTISGTEPITMQVESGNSAITANNSNGNGAHTIFSGLVLTGPLTITQNSTGPLTLSGAISGASVITKNGPGTLNITGTGSNSNSGYTVNEGMLVLNKVSAVATGFGTITIGDGVGGKNADVVMLAAASQFPIGVRIVMHESGMLDGGMNFNVVTGGMTFNGGNVVNPNLRLTANIVTQASAESAVFSGGSIEFFGTVRTITVADGAAVNDMEINSRISNGGFIKAGPGQLVLGGAVANDHALGTTVNAGTVIAAKPTAFGAGLLNVNSATVRLQADLPQAVEVTALNPTGSAVVDMTNNDMVIDYTGASPLDSIIKPALISGYANGAWNGPGINSSTAAAITTQAVGYAEATDLFTSFPATFGGVSVDDTSVLLAHTLYGDANLDGIVNLSDFNRLAANFGSGDEWPEGDFNFDGMVNLQDFNRLAANFGLSAGPDGPTPEDWAALASAVPDPAALLVGCWSLLATLHRPRRRRANRAARK